MIIIEKWGLVRNVGGLKGKLIQKAAFVENISLFIYFI